MPLHLSYKRIAEPVEIILGQLNWVISIFWYTGVGKTVLAKTLANHLFNNEKGATNHWICLSFLKNISISKLI